MRRGVKTGFGGQVVVSIRCTPHTQRHTVHAILTRVGDAELTRVGARRRVRSQPLENLGWVLEARGGRNRSP